MTDVKRIDIKEFQELGFLQEANRLFFHPHGLALEVVVEEDGSRRLGGVWDYRDDPEGVVFGNGGYGDSVEKAKIVAAARAVHAAHRMELFGTDPDKGDPDIEPLDWTYPESEIKP